MKKLAIVSSHPIQYNAPWFELLAAHEGVDLKVFYTWSQSETGIKFDPGFGKKIEWDIPLLKGYNYTFVRNTSKNPGTHHFNGLINPTLNDEIKQWAPDFILLFGWNFHSHIRCIRYFHKKIPLLFRGDSTLLNERPGLKKYARRIFLRWVYSHIDYALYVGTQNKKYFLKHGLKQHQLIFAPHAIDNNRFAEPDKLYNGQAVEWRKKLGISEQDTVALYAGKIEPVKNPFFIEGLGKKINVENIKIVVVGNGKLEKELKERCRENKNIFFLDFQNQNNMPAIYRIGDIFILPSVSETWGLSVNEAMACNRPVAVSKNVGCAIDLVHENGIIFDASDIDGCYEFITRLSVDKDFNQRLGHRSQEIIKAYSFEAIRDSLLFVMRLQN